MLLVTRPVAPAQPAGSLLRASTLILAAECRSFHTELDGINADAAPPGDLPARHSVPDSAAGVSTSVSAPPRHGHMAMVVLAPLTRLLASTIRKDRAPQRWSAMATSILAAAASSWAVPMGIAPVLQIRRTLLEQSSRQVSAGYFAVLLVGFLLWIAYGAAAGIVALVIPNIIAFLVAATVVVVALRLGGRPARTSSPAAPAGDPALHPGRVLMAQHGGDLLASSPARPSAGAPDRHDRDEHIQGGERP
jgi:MtN3 and saliva related transmembrane protein